MSELRDRLIVMKLWESNNLGDPSEDEISAMLLMGKVSSFGFFWNVSKVSNGYYAGLRLDPICFTVGDSKNSTLPLAICNAIINARDVIQGIIDAKYRSQRGNDDNL